MLGYSLLLAVAALQAAEADSTWIRGVFTGKSPRPILLPEADAWQHAADLAGRTPGAFVLAGMGDSMLPLYRPGTVLVLQKTSFERLERGQTAVYRNSSDHTVAHVLVTRARDGWRITGLNTKQHDMEPVRPENFVGVVIAAFEPADAPQTVGTRIAAR